MTAVLLTPEDLAPFASIPDAKAEAMIEDALAQAERVAPCITTDEFQYPAAAKAILRGAVLRWNDAGSGALTTRSETASIFAQSVSVDTRQTRRGLFWPSEIEQLQDLCKGPEVTSGAFNIDTAPCPAIVHADICALNFGATYCSCGAILTLSYPLYEV